MKDLFAGGLRKEARETQYTYNQLASWVMAKMAAVLQVTDTDAAFRCKAKLNRSLERLRCELLDLAALEKTRPVFKCGYYEILRVVVESIEQITYDAQKDMTLKKAFVRNGWLALRPKVSDNKFVRVQDEPWVEDLVLWKHRLRKRWCEQRFNHLDSEACLIVQLDARSMRKTASRILS